MKKNISNNGFTLTELLAVIVIIAIIIGIAIPIYINLTNNTKQNEYISKKSYLENIGQRYAEENNVSNTTKISVSRLIAAGYTPAETYLNGTDMPFISNPIDDEDNLACRVITITLDNYEINASISEESDCNFAESDLADSKLGINAYTFENNTIGDPIYFESNTTFNWTNKDVIVVVNPLYDDYKNIAISVSGNSHLVDTNYMLKDIYKGKVINPNDYTNIAVINASLITKQNVSVSLERESSISSTSVEVRIDKEAPMIDTQSFKGWTSTSKGATIYLSDGAGSGSRGVYVSEEDNFSKKDNQLKYVGDDESVSISQVNNKNLANKRYYLWAVDKAGNISLVSSYIDISNIDDEKPIVTEFTVSSNKVGYNSTSATVKIGATDGTGSGVTYACIKNTPGYQGCDWKVFGNGTYIDNNYKFNASEGSGSSFTLYSYVKDAVGNVSENTYKTYTYKIYTKCEQVNYSAYTQCSAVCNGGTQTSFATDKFFGSACPSKNVVQKCNEVDCCSKTVDTAWTQCSKGCATGTQTKQVKSAYDGRICKTVSQPCNQDKDCCKEVNYSSWSSCPTCGNNPTKSRTKTSKITGQSCGVETVSCGVPSCCSSVNYGEWSKCSDACGGTQTRKKTSKANGSDCGVETRSCGGKTSTVDKNSCSAAKCGTGQYKRVWTSKDKTKSCGITWDGGTCDGSKKGDNKTFTSNGSYTAPCDAVYNVTLWGGQGGGDGGAAGGKGAKYEVSVKLKAGDKAEFVIGGEGGTASANNATDVNGGANGGGKCYWSGGGGGRTDLKLDGKIVASAAGGGGATHGITGRDGRCTGTSDTITNSKNGESNYKKVFDWDKGKYQDCAKDAGGGGGGWNGGIAGIKENCPYQESGYGGVSGNNSKVTKESCTKGVQSGSGKAYIKLKSWN